MPRTHVVKAAAGGTAVYLASDDSSATTGQVLHVNGGSYMP